MRTLKTDIFMTDKELEYIERKYTEKFGEQTVVLPPYLEQVEGKIFYLCDGLACDKCDNDLCHHTSDIRHAKNFRQVQDGTFWEVCDDEAR